MPGYIFIPVATPEMLQFAVDWRVGQHEKGKIPYTVLNNKHESGIRKGLSRIGGGCLKRLTLGDKLYVLSHGPGTHGGGYIGAERSGVMKKYSPAELAVLLEAEGLTKNFMDLRIYACGSGVEINSTASFAQHLSREMRARGYRSIRVTGYLGLVKSSYSYRAIPPYGLDQTDTKHKGVYSPEIAEHFPASTRKVTF